MYAPKRKLVAATRLGDGLKKDVLAKDTSTVFKLIYVAIPDQPLTRSALGLKKACDAQVPLRAGRSLDHVYFRCPRRMRCCLFGKPGCSCCSRRGCTCRCFSWPARGSPRSSVPLPLPLNTAAVVDLGAMPESEQRALLARFLEAQAAR